MSHRRPFGCFCGTFQPLPSPQALHALIIDLLAGISEKSSNPAVAITVILPSQLNHVGDKAFLVFSAPWAYGIVWSDADQAPDRHGVH